MGTGYGVSGFNNDFWEYDPATNAWTQKANFLVGHVNTLLDSVLVQRLRGNRL